jgi:putative transposase
MSQREISRQMTPIEFWRWTAPRIHGELLKLGTDVCQATVAKYMVRPRRPPSQTWRTFLANHIAQVMAADFFVVPTATCRLLFLLVILAPERRRVVHVAVTEYPTAASTAKQLREAFPSDRAPRYLLRIAIMHSTPGRTRRPRWISRRCSRRPAHPGRTRTSNASSDRRGECVDHVLVFNATGLQRLMKCYCAYYDQSRTHLSLNKDVPIPRPMAAPVDGRVVAIPEVGGLHHRYERQAA